MSAKTFEEWDSTRPFPTPEEAQEIIFEGHRCVVMDPECYEECFKQAKERAALLADAPDVERVAREYRDNAAKYPIGSEIGQRLGFVAYCLESLATQQARIKALEDRLEIPKRGAHKHLDGIACRDETIRLQDVRIRELEARLEPIKGYDNIDAMAVTIKELEGEIAGLKVALNTERTNAAGWRDRAADAERKIYRSENPVEPDAARES